MKITSAHIMALKQRAEQNNANFVPFCIRCKGKTGDVRRRNITYTDNTVYLDATCCQACFELFQFESSGQAPDWRPTR